MNKFIKRIIFLPSLLQLSVILMLSLLTGFVAYKTILKPQNTVMIDARSELLKMENEIDRYYLDKKTMISKKQKFTDLSNQLSIFESKLANFNQNAPERLVLDSALKSQLKTQQIKISGRLEDGFGFYYLVSLTVIGFKSNVNQFFTSLLEQQELAIWQQLAFHQIQDQLSMSLEIKYYFELKDDI